MADLSSTGLMGPSGVKETWVRIWFRETLEFEVACPPQEFLERISAARSIPGGGRGRLRVRRTDGGASSFKACYIVPRNSVNAFQRSLYAQVDGIGPDTSIVRGWFRTPRAGRIATGLWVGFLSLYSAGLGIGAVVAAVGGDIERAAMATLGFPVALFILTCAGILASSMLRTSRRGEERLVAWLEQGAV